MLQQGVSWRSQQRICCPCVWLRYLHSFDGDEAKLSACAVGFTRPALSMAKKGKELELKAFGDPGGFVPTK